MIHEQKTWTNYNPTFTIFTILSVTIKFYYAIFILSFYLAQKLQFIIDAS